MPSAASRLTYVARFLQITLPTERASFVPRASYQWSRKEICVKEADEISKIKKKHHYRTSGIITNKTSLLGRDVTCRGA